MYDQMTDTPNAPTLTFWDYERLMASGDLKILKSGETPSKHSIVIRVDTQE